MRSHLVKLALVIGSVLGTLVLADLVLLIWHGPVRVVENFYEPHPHYGYRMRANLEFVFASPYHGYEARVRTNSRGLRDGETAIPKPAGVFRILLLGDSMTAGLEVEQGDTFESVCESRLRRHGAVDVVNAGVRGYNLDNILGFFESEGPGYAADVVVYVFTDNDVVSDEGFAPEGTDISRGFTIRGALGRLAAYSHLTYRVELLRQMRSLRRQRDRDAAKPDTAVLPGGLLALFTNQNFAAVREYRLTAQRIERLALRCAALSGTFLLAGAPQQEEIDPAVQRWWGTLQIPNADHLDFDGARHYLDWVAGELGIERLDPIPEFRARLLREGPYWFHKDGHLNTAGHRLMGELLAAKVEQLPSFAAWRSSAARTAGPSRP